MDGEKEPEMKDVVMTGADPAGNDLKEVFRSKMVKIVKDLCDRGQPVNEAAALAIRITCGAVHPPPHLPHLLSTLADARSNPSPATVDGLKSMVAAAFAVPECMGVTFLRSPKTPKDPTAPGFDGESLKTFYEGIVKLVSGVLMGSWFRMRGIKLDHDEVSATLMSAVKDSVHHLAAAAARNSLEVSVLHPIIGLLMNPLFLEPEHHPVLESLCTLVVTLPQTNQDKADKGKVGGQVDRLCAQDLDHLVSTLQQFLTITLFESADVSASVQAATNLLHLLHESNERVRRVPISSFYNDALNADEFNIQEDYQKWVINARGTRCFTFLSYPFLYDPSTKSTVLRIHNIQQMSTQFEEALFSAFLAESVAPFNVIRVRREHLIADAIAQVQRRPMDVKKPLKVQFVGEEGVDEGGVQKEFFQLLFREILDPKFGMFSYNPDTRLFWFNSSPLDFCAEFELIGQMMGLAVYNGHILGLKFPSVLYKKMLNRSVGLDDLADVNPHLAKGLKELLTFEGDVQETYQLTFQVSVQDMFGVISTVDLKEGGADLPVTSATRADYVSLSTHFHLTSSISAAFDAFSSGFTRVCGGPILRMFEAEELEMLICGSTVLDFEALEKGTRYEDGYTGESEVIQLFWKLVHSFTEDQKKKLLFFVTGSDRVPIKGLADLAFVISRNGSDSDRLPTSHTCFNHLLLPEYKSIEKIRDRLIMAVNNAEGFGLM